MTYKGLVKGKSIELEEALPFPDGELVHVSIEPFDRSGVFDGASAIRSAMHAPPHLAPNDVDELDRVIAEGKLPVRHGDLFGPDINA